MDCASYPPPPLLASPELGSLCAGLSDTNLRVEPLLKTYRRRYPAYISGSWAGGHPQRSSRQLTQSPEAHSSSPNSHQTISKSKTLVVESRHKGHLHDVDTTRVSTTIQDRQAYELADERYYGDDENTHDDIYTQCPPSSPVNGPPTVAGFTYPSTDAGVENKRPQALDSKYGQRLATSRRARPRRESHSSKRRLDRIRLLMRTKALLLLASRRRNQADAILSARMWRESNGLGNSHRSARHSDRH